MQPMGDLPPNKTNKSKQKSLDLLGFLWPNRDFSKGYTGKNKKIPFRLSSPAGLWTKRVKPLLSSHSRPRADRCRPTSSLPSIVAPVSI
jgi:hypothetical protein